MTESTADSPPARLRVWTQAVRAFAFPASIVPVLVGAAVAASQPGPVLWWAFPLALLGGVLFHAGTNLVSEYYDYARGVDRPDTGGRNNVLVRGLLRPGQVFRAGVLMFALACGASGVFVWIRGWPVVWLGLAAVAGGFFYTGWPVGYKYRAMGDVMVFILMGSLMVVGTCFVMTGGWPLKAMLASVPIGCLVAAILHANNLRDIETDRRMGVRTLANVLGLRVAKVEYCLLVLGAFACLAVIAATGVVSRWAMLAFLSLPLGARNIGLILRARSGNTHEVATVDVRTAQLHLLFGVLFSAGIAMEGWMGKAS